MEADWAVEIGAEVPVIDAFWPGWVDLMTTPERVIEIQETAEFPALAQALVQINRNPIAENISGFWTAKCDLWKPDEWDRDELDANEQEAHAAQACYIDLLPRDPASGVRAVYQQWSDAEQLARMLAHQLRAIKQPRSRVDCVVRAAFLDRHEGFALTLYFTACGSDESAAAAGLSTILHSCAGELAYVARSQPATNLLVLQ